MPGASAGPARTARSPQPSRRATTGRAASMSISSTPARPCRRRCAPSFTRLRVSPARAISAWSICCKVDGEVAGAVGVACRKRRAGRDLGQGDHRRHRRADPALPAQQRLHQHGRRRLCAVSARRRAADRHGVRAVLPDRPSGAAADRHGPDHVGPVPLQARRPAAQQGHAGVHRPLRRAGGRQIRHHPRCRHLRHHQGGRGRPRLAARRRVSELPACPGGEAARGVRPGDRPARGERHRSHAGCRSRSRRSRTTTWAASRPT